MTDVSTNMIPVNASSADTSSELPAIGECRVGDALVQTSDGRELHGLLKVGRDFTTWIKGRIAQYGFVEGVDFVTVDTAPRIGGAGNRGARTDYFLTLGMAKEVSMVENNAEGRRIRRYYIEFERRTLEAASRRSGPAIPQSLPEALRLAADLAEANARQAEQIAIAVPKAAALDRIADTTGLILPSDAAKAMGLRPKDLTEHMLEGSRWLFRRPGSGRLAARQDKLNARLLDEKTVPVGENRTEIQVYVTPKGLTRLAQILGVTVTMSPDLFATPTREARHG